MTEMPLVGVENKCEASCPKRATVVLEILGRPFRFCDRCAARHQDAIEICNKEHGIVLTPA